MKQRQFRFQGLILAVCYSDGWVDSLKAQGKIKDEASYTVCYIDLGKDYRIVLIDLESKTDYPDIPIVTVAREKVSAEELAQICEIRLTEDTKKGVN